MVKKWAARERLSLDQLDKDRGIVALFSDNSQGSIVLAAGSDEALLHTAREFFLRWPYLWEIWGREEGDTYLSLEDDLHTFFNAQQLPCSQITIVKACYDFPTITSPHDAIKKLRFDPGEIKDLFVAVDFDHPETQIQAIHALGELKHCHKRGISTDKLSYPGCARITFELRSNGKVSKISLPRVGHPKRMLTPSPGAHWITSRLVLNTAGVSFPMTYLDHEIENKQILKAPILIGKDNQWSQELQDAGKIKMLQMEKG